MVTQRTTLSKEIELDGESGSSMQWQAKTEFSLKINELPKATRVVFKIMPAKYNAKADPVPSSWAGIMLYDYLGELVTGNITLSTWAGKEFKPAQSSSMAILNLERSQAGFNCGTFQTEMLTALLRYCKARLGDIRISIA